MKKIFLSAALIATLFTGCSNELIDAGDFPDNPANPSIDFTPMEFGVSEAITRGAQTAKSDITAYGVSASIYPAANTYTTAGCGSYWFCDRIEAASGRSNHYWPGASYRVSFFAYAPYGNAALTVRSKDDLGYPVYTYTVPTAIANQVDFITADVTDHSGAGITDPVPLTFSHQLTDVRFRVYNQGSSSITVHSIAIYGVKYSGTFSGSTWTLNTAVNSSSSNPFLLSLGTSVDAGATVDVTGTTNHFIMLPQTVASGTDIFVVDATVSGVRKTYTSTLSSALELLRGRSYTFTLKLGEGSLIVDTDTDIQDWAVEVKYLTVSGVSTNGTFTQPSVADADDNGIEDWTEEE